MKRPLFVICLVLLTLTACQFPQLNLFKKIIKHPAPELLVDNSYFTELGCFNDPACLPEELKNLEAPINSIYKPGNILGGLDPTFPLALASTRRFSDEAEIQSVYVNRCLARQYIRYLVVVDGKMRLIDSIEGLAAIFAPIDSADEALSFAAAATGLSAVYDLHKFPRPKLYSDTVEETFVKETNDGYTVHLFHTYLCGCGPHINFSVDVTVTKDGVVSRSEPVQAFSDPKFDDMCID